MTESRVNLRKLKISIYGGSHEDCIGVAVEGFPAGERVDMERLRAFLVRRSACGKAYATPRKEPDEPVIISGIRGGETDGGLFRAEIKNLNARSSDYSFVYDTPRPGHADFAALSRHKNGIDLRGGGKYSGRMTAPLCIAGGLALQMLARRGIRVFAHALSISGVFDEVFDPVRVGERERALLEGNGFPVLNTDRGRQMIAAIEAASVERDSVGGIIECAVTGLAAGQCGDALFEGIEAAVSYMVFAIPAVKGIEFGQGFALAGKRGSESNDAFVMEEGLVRTVTNNCGGILGGISNGMPVVFRAVVKPTPTIGKRQQSVSLVRGENAEIEVGGRHDPCIVPRAVPCVEAAAALAVFDLF